MRMVSTVVDKAFIIKGDRRFKVGNIRKVNNIFRGHPETVKIERLDTTNAPIEYRLNPPIVINTSLAMAMENAGFFDV